MMILGKSLPRVSSTPIITVWPTLHNPTVRWIHSEAHAYHFLIYDLVFGASISWIFCAIWSVTTFSSSTTDWATVAAAGDFPGNTYFANTTSAKPANGDHGDDDIDIYSATTLIDLFEPAGITYKIYLEEYPTSSQCWFGTLYNATPTDGGVNNNQNTRTISRLYRRKHNPLISFQTFTSSSTRCANMKDFNDLSNDVVAGALPSFSYIVPNTAHDGHDTDINYTATWYTQFVRNLTQSPLFATSRVLVHVAYDEDDTAYTYYNNDRLDKARNPNPYWNPSCVVPSQASPNTCAPAGCTDLQNCTLDKNDNKVYSVLFGSALRSRFVNTTDSTFYTHSSIVATLEANWGLGSLGRQDVNSNPFFVDASPSTTPVPQQPSSTALESSVAPISVPNAPSAPMTAAPIRVTNQPSRGTNQPSRVPSQPSKVSKGGKGQKLLLQSLKVKTMPSSSPSKDADITQVTSALVEQGIASSTTGMRSRKTPNMLSLMGLFGAFLIVL